MPDRRTFFRTRSAALLALAVAWALAVAAAPAGAATIESGTSVHSDLSPPLRTLQPKRNQANGAHPARRFGKTLDELRLDPQDRGRQSVDAPAAAPVPGQQWEGIGNVNGVIPPDTNGDVGPRDYVQWVNLSFEVFAKDGTSRYGPVPGNTLWQGFGGVCESSNEGDPVAIYDRAADRWVMAQFAFGVQGGHDVPPYYECVAVSQTGDPTGAYYRYAFQLTGATDDFPDYPKVGVWNDAYYVTTNNFGANFVGAGIYALDRTKMLAGDAGAGFVGQQLGPQYGGLLPAHRDGPTPPPAGAPGYFAGVDTNSGTSGSNLQLWTMHPNFANPAATTVSGPTLIPVTAYNFAFCGVAGSSSCIAQPGTTRKLDPLADRLMNRLEYRNFGDHESLLLTHNVNAGSDQAGERWYELRNIASSPTVYQQGTYAPADGVSRWMGSAAMDGYGDIALGYSASSSSVKPSIRYTGRLGTDVGQLGLMTQGEQTIVSGGGSQTGYSRWGDYSSMSIDPVDDSTFWYTNEYYTANSSAGWHTRIASFKLVSTPTVAITTPADGGGSTGTPSLSGTASGGTGDVTVKIYSGGSTSGTVLQTLTSTPSAGAWNVTATTLPEGTYTAQAQQSDAAGRVGYSKLSTFRVDATAPVVGVTTPADGSLTKNSKPTVSGTAGTAPGDLNAISVRIHSGSSVSDPVAQTLTTNRSGSSWSVTPTTAVADGAHAVEASQSDSAGNVGTSAPNVFTVDTVPPALTLDTPAASTTDRTPTFTGTPGGATGDGAVSVKLYGGTNTAVAPIQTLPVSGSWSATASTLSDGQYTVVASQSDSAGNTQTRQATFTVDNVAPALTLSTPASPTNDNTPTFSGSAGSAAGDGPVSVKLYSGTNTAVAPLQTPSASGSWSATAAGLSDGQYTIVATQSDSAGNTQVRQATFTVDTVAPALTLDTPAALTNDRTPAFTGTPGGATGDGAVSVKLYSGTNTSVAPLQTLSVSGSWSATASTLSDGQYTVVATQSDSAGNTQTRQATFTVDATAPALTLNTPPSATNDNTPTFTGTPGGATGDGAVSVKLYSGTNTSVAPIQTPSVSGSWSATAAALNDGQYTVVAAQSDSAGNTQTRQATFTVDTTSTPNVLPIAAFGFSPSSPLTGASVAFDGSASHDPDGSLMDWAWEFGDGATGSGATISHSYSAAGSYTVQLTVTDNDSATATTSRQVTVSAPVVPAGEQPASPQIPPPIVAPLVAPVAPRLTLRLAHQTLDRVLRRGLSVLASSDQEGPVKLELRITRRLARSLHLGRKLTIARATRTLGAGTTARLVLRLSRAARSRIAGRSRLPLRLRMTFGTTMLEQRLTLRR